MAVRIERDGAVGAVVLDRPERAHAYDAAHLDALRAGVAALASDCAVVIVRSTGDRAFCAGADLDELRGRGPLHALELESQRVFTQLARVGIVTVAVIQGAAVAGGFELALACDLRVAGPGAAFWFPETALGIVPSAGGLTRAARLVGPARAKEMVLTGRRVDAPTALAWGLVHRVEADPLAAARAWAAEIATRDPAALRLAKQVLDAAESDASLARERVAEAILYSRR